MTATLHALGMGRDAGAYYTSDPNREARPHRRDEYYVGGVDEPDATTGAGGGIWWSSGETIVAHGSAVDAEVFRDICAGLDPRTGDGPSTAASLVRGAGHGHRAGWDMTFSAPKGVSLLWAAGDEGQRGMIQTAHVQAVESALSFLEREGLVEVRLGAGGTQRERPTDLMVARFDHFTSREGDPNMHSHCVIMNCAGSADGKYRTLEPRTAYAWQKTVGAYYRMNLSERLHEHGFSAREAGRGQFEVAGIDQHLIDRFSKRGAQIEAIVGDRADASGRQKEIANLSTRKGKDQVPTGDALEARWNEEFGVDRQHVWEGAIQAGFGRQRLIDSDLVPDPSDHDGRAVEEFPVVPEVAGDGIVARAASEVLRHEIVIRRRTLLEKAFAFASLGGHGEQSVISEFETLEAERGLVGLTSSETRDSVWTTPVLVELEAEMLKAARRSGEREWLTQEAIATAIDAAPHLSEEQVQAVWLAGSHDGVSLLQAGAGTGKTTTAKPIVHAAQLSGLRVIGMAPSWVAADELRKSTGIPAVAIAKWLYDRKQGTALPLDDRTVLIVDEASMIGTRDMAAILVAARDAGSKVLLVGDQRQLEAVGAGGPLRIVADALDREATLEQVRRQQIAWQRDASIAMAKGDVSAGVQTYIDRGSMEIAEGREAVLAQSILAWTALRQRHGQDTLLMTRRNRDVSELNRQARLVLQGEGHLTGEDIVLPSINREGKVVGISLSIGDRLRFGQSHPTLGFRNGTQLTIEGLRRYGGNVVVTLKTADGQLIQTGWQELSPVYKGRTQPPRIVHAYASTVNGAQGRTVAAAVYAAVTEPDARELYVGLTRHAQDARIVIDKALVEAGVSFQPAQEIEVNNGISLEPVTRWKSNIIDFQ